jgi:hypothetical protein
MADDDTENPERLWLDLPEIPAPGSSDELPDIPGLTAGELIDELPNIPGLDFDLPEIGL